MATLNDQLRDAGRNTIAGGDVPTGLGGGYGYTREQLAKITDDASTCSKSPDTLYPMHEYKTVGSLQGRDLEMCKVCGLLAVNHDENGMKLLTEALEEVGLA